MRRARHWSVEISFPIKGIDPKIVEAQRGQLDRLFEWLRYAGLGELKNSETLTPTIVLYPPKSIETKDGERTWALTNAQRISSFGYIATAKWRDE